MESILFLGFTLNAWIVIVTVLLVFILMLCTKLPADFVFLGAMTVLMVMIAVSSSFATPIGSRTHMLVYGPGGYRFSDFMRVGFFMNLIIWAASLFITPLLFPH